MSLTNGCIFACSKHPHDLKTHIGVPGRFLEHYHMTTQVTKNTANLPLKTHIRFGKHTKMTTHFLYSSKYSPSATDHLSKLTCPFIRFDLVYTNKLDFDNCSSSPSYRLHIFDQNDIKVNQDRGLSENHSNRNFPLG